METSYKPIPSTKLLYSFLKIPELMHNPIPVFQAGFNRYGEVYRVRGLRGAVLINNADCAQHILQKNHRNYHKSEVQSEYLAAHIGRGLLTANGAYWLQQRKLIQPGFHRPKLAELVKIMQAETNRFMGGVMDEYLEKGEEFDFAYAMMQVTFRIVSKSLFSYGVSDDELDRLAFIVNELQRYLIIQIRNPYKLPWLYLTGKIQYYKRLREESDGILFRIIRERKASGERHDDLLDMLLDVRYEDTGEGMTDQQLRDESLILFLAGHETSANALAWLFYTLTKHPDVVDKILAEVEETVGDRDVTFGDIPRLTYTKQVIQEGMRLFPPAWAVDRVALEDDEVAGYKIDKGTSIALFIYGIHHNPKYWDNPEEFRPERFTKENIKKRHRFAYFPFGGGPRLCIGHNFAYMEMQLVVTNLLRKYRFELTSSEEEIDLEPLVTLRPRNGIRMRIYER